MITIDDLKKVVQSHLGSIDLTLLDDAWELVYKKHKGKLHFSGESYLSHVLEVSSTLASMHLDLESIIAGLLHGVMKEGVSFEDLKSSFGEDIATIVAGATKIKNVHYSSKLAYQAENIRKLLLAISADIRVLLVKLADRLHDMYLLDMVADEKQKEIAQETMDLYAPLASRIGIDWLKRDLEDFAFKFIHPKEYKQLTLQLDESIEERQQYVNKLIVILKNKLAENDLIPINILGRPKHLNSIYNKIIAQGIPLERVYDKVAFRIIVNDVDECYKVLGVIHANWSPIPTRIKDFISVPKANNYRSLHTTVAGPKNHFVEIQIRTEEMDRVAKEGIAAHWAYKDGQKISVDDAKLFEELKKLVHNLQEVEDNKDFLEEVKGELQASEIYVLTPGGDVKKLPNGSCPIDFAYSIHTAIGDHCVSAKVNGRLVPLKHKLTNGDIVEIETSKSQQPRRGWLEIVKSSRSRSRIRSWLRQEKKDQALKLGREMCEVELRKSQTTLKKMVRSGHIKLLLKKLRCNSLDDMLAKVGSGVIDVQNLVRALRPPEVKATTLSEEIATENIEKDDLDTSIAGRKSVKSDAELIVDGMDDMMVTVSKCCNPLPGDKVVGVIVTGKGVSVHKRDCHNLQNSDSQRWIEVTWGNTKSGSHLANILIKAENKRGALAEISSSISADEGNVVELSAMVNNEDTADINITVEVANVSQLKKMFQHLRQLEYVIMVHRK